MQGTTGLDSSLPAEAAVMIPPLTTALEPMEALGLALAEKYESDVLGAEQLSSTVMGLRRIMPEEYHDQHLETAKALCAGLAIWPCEGIMTQLFLLANNFTLNGKLKPEEKGYSQRKRPHDERIANLLYQLGRNGLQHVKCLLSTKGPTADAIKQQIFSSVMRLEEPAMLRFILTAGVELDTTIETLTGAGWGSPLSFAAGIKDGKKSFDFVRLLIDAGADVNFRIFSGATDSALTSALRTGHMDVVNMLIEEGARACSSSLACAIRTGRDEIVQLILKAGADVNSPFGVIWEHITTPIGLAALLGHFKIARTLIERGADINAMQRTYCTKVVSLGCVKLPPGHHRTPTTALGIAIVQRHLKIAQLLLEQPEIKINQLSADHYVCPLLIACDQGHDGIATKLLDAGADVLAADTSGMGLPCKSATVLSALIRRRRGKINMALVEVLISKGARLDHALLEAACSNNRELVTFLLNRGAPLRVSDSGFDQTALGCAIEKGLVDMAQFLYDTGLVDPGNPRCIKHVDMVRFLRQTQLLSGILHANGPMLFSDAIRRPSRSLLRQLMTHHGDIDFSQTPTGSSASSNDRVVLDDAIDFSSAPKFIRYLVDRGAAFGRQTLRIAVQNERANEILDALLSTISPTLGRHDIEPEPDWQSEDDSGGDNLEPDDPPAIVIAAQLEDPSILRILLNATNWGSRRMGVALTAAILYRRPDQVRDLRGAGASLDEAFCRSSMSSTCVSALAAAVEEEDVELAVDLIKAGANVNKPAGYAIGARTALQMAAEIGHLELVRILIEEGADVDAPPGERMGATALQCAAIGGYLEVARRLLHAGADVNAAAPDHDSGRTALEGAAENGRLEMVHLLLEEGARLKGIYTEQYVRAVAFAKDYGHHAVAKFLESTRGSRAEPDD